MGVCHLSGHLWLVVEFVHEPSYLVYEFEPDAVFSTVVDLEAIRRVAPLQEVWPVDKNIRSAGTKIRTMFALYSHQYDRSKVMDKNGDRNNKNSGNAKANQTTGGIVFVTIDKVSIIFHDS